MLVNWRFGANGSSDGRALSVSKRFHYWLWRLRAPPPVISAVRLLAPPAVQGAQLLTKGKQGIIPGETVFQFSLDQAVTVAPER
jgi:hypothetical protein